MYSGLKKYKTTVIILIVISALFFGSLPAVHAQNLQTVSVVEAFKEDNVHLAIGGNTTHVTRTLTIENEANESIVPGYIVLMLQKQTPDMIGPLAIPFTSEVKPVSVQNVKAYFQNGLNITDINVTENNNSTVIQYGAWMPIDPGATLTVILEYDSPDIVDNGLLFSTVDYPFTSSSIPVDNAVVEADINGGHVSYASEKPTMNGSTYVWEQPQLGMGSWSVAFEYSALPLPLLPISGSMLLWGLIILICLVWVAWTYTRPRKGQNKPR